MTRGKAKKTKPKTAPGPAVPSGNNHQASASYTAKDIFVLEGLEPVRKRPGMYIGSTGPDGLHHLIWEVIDNSLTRDTPVLIEQNGKVALAKIGEVIDRAFAEAVDSDISAARSGQAEILRTGFSIKSLSFNPETLKLSWVPVSSLIRHPVNSDIYEVTLQNNRKIQITPYHSLFTLKQGQVVPVKGSDLREGSCVVVPARFPEPEAYPAQINLLDEFLALPEKETKSIRLYGVSRLLDEEFKPWVKQYCAEHRLENKKTKRTWSNIFCDYRRCDYLPLNLVRTLPDTLRSRLAECRLGNKTQTNFSLPARLAVTRELVELLGIYAAEGTVLQSKQTNRVVFSFGSHETELVEYVKQLIQKVFGYAAASRYAHESARTIQIDSLAVRLLFQRIFAAGENSHRKKIPSLIFQTNPSLRLRYLIAYLAGDGCPAEEFTRHLLANTAPPQEERRKFSAVSASRELVEGLSYLLFSLGKTFSLGEQSQAPGRTISLRYHARVRLAQITTPTHSYRLDFYWSAASSYLNRIPVADTCARISWNRPYAFSLNTRGGITREKATALQTAQRIELYPGAAQFMDSDLGILKVVKIEKVAYDHPWVYDFSVPQGENFVGGSAPIMVHNSIDEAMAGFARTISVEILPGNEVRVADDGRGIPVEIHPQTKKSTLETVLTTLHAGGKFGGDAYKVSGGLHGVGVSVVNALSTRLRAEVHKGGGIFVQEYRRGDPTGKVKRIGSTARTGTIITFSPDDTVFSTLEFNYRVIVDHLRQQAFLTKGVRIVLLDRRADIPLAHGFCFEGGLLSFVKHLARDKDLLQEEAFYVTKRYEKIEVEAGFLFLDDLEVHELSFANNIYTPDGGMHLTGFRSALTRTLNNYARTEGYLKEKDENFTSEDTREGLIAVVSIKLPEPQFEGQTKARLGNPDARTAVEAVVNEALKEFLEKRPGEARRILDKVTLAAKARKAAKAAKDTVLRKGALEGMTLPGKLADCTSKDPSESELFIVEGQSAGGSATGGRDRRTQAILPLRGKILNVERARLDRMLGNEEIRTLVIALGTAIAEEFDLSKIRYHKIILMTDADVDGAHLRTLLLTLFYRYFRPMIEAGYLYIAQPPLYRIQAAKTIRYAFSDSERNKVVAELERAKKERAAANPKTGRGKAVPLAEEGGAGGEEMAAPAGTELKGISIQRFKGLGEMNAEELQDTTMSAENRVLRQVTIDDAEEADRLFGILMGDEVEPRKQFIQAEALTVKNLDI
ncbi:MAG: DNA gyrase subunit B [Candidatus Liptonbacteria bacterium]|nr:DNA gyrase subunit B [Candidatus Liptonbacteria bacterium]